MADFDPLFLNTRHNLFSRRFFTQGKYKKNMIPSLQPKPRDSANSKRKIHDKPTQHTNQETKPSVAIMPLTIDNGYDNSYRCLRLGVQRPSWGEIWGRPCKRAGPDGEGLGSWNVGYCRIITLWFRMSRSWFIQECDTSCTIGYGYYWCRQIAKALERR